MEFIMLGTFFWVFGFLWMLLIWSHLREQTNSLKRMEKILSGRNGMEPAGKKEQAG